MGIFPFIIDYCLEMIIITLNLIGLYILTYTITTTKKKFQYTLCKVSQILSLTFFLNQTLGKIFASTSKKLTLSLYYLIYSFWWRVKIFYVISLCIYKKYSNMYFYVCLGLSLNTQMSLSHLLYLMCICGCIGYIMEGQLDSSYFLHLVEI